MRRDFENLAERIWNLEKGKRERRYEKEFEKNAGQMTLRTPCGVQSIYLSKAREYESRREFGKGKARE